MSGEFLADSLHSDSDLNLHNGAVFQNVVSLAARGSQDNSSWTAPDL